MHGALPRPRRATLHHPSCCAAAPPRLGIRTRIRRRRTSTSAQTQAARDLWRGFDAREDVERRIFKQTPEGRWAEGG